MPTNQYISFLIAVLLSIVSVTNSEYYSFDGTGNNLDNDDWGSSGMPYRRIDGEADVTSYTDGVSQMDSSLPNARQISNLFGQLSISSSSDDEYTQLTMLAFAFGTMVTFDLCNNEMNFTSQNYDPVDIPRCDYFWDSSCEGNKTMPFYRTKAQLSDEFGRIPPPFLSFFNLCDRSYSGRVFIVFIVFAFCLILFFTSLKFFFCFFLGAFVLFCFVLFCFVLF